VRGGRQQVREVAGDVEMLIWHMGRRGANWSRLSMAVHGQAASSTAVARPGGRCWRPASRETPRCTHRARGGDGGGRRPRQ
jgi:hypothetical protein